MKILIIEDDIAIAVSLETSLRQAGWITDHFQSGKDGLNAALANTYDVAILDLMLPDGDGLAVISELRRRANLLPVLILSAKRSLDARVEGLRLGGDDYLTKPFSLDELIARLKALVRRSSGFADSTLLSFADVSLNLVTRQVTREGRFIDLQPREFALLEFFLRNVGRVLSKTVILEKIWDYHFDPHTNVVDVLVCRLRSKLNEERVIPLISTIRGAGYVLK